ncbi:cytospin-B isoform X1 [Gadus macrocephalus]|uniref:cytospin-B isoform X1 n=1 Tax=Gadus macrocephalus TaxID=80720 RepID=UPI0028CB7C50|nr:cytospin-B isoform X1 [Gadus macrocephalus]
MTRDRREHPVATAEEPQYRKGVGRRQTAMLKGATTKVGLPKPGPQERARHASIPSSSTIPSSSLRTSRSSNTLASDLRLSRMKRASSDDALAKPALGAATSRMRKTVTTGAISDLPEARPRTLTGATGNKKSGIPAPKELPTSITRDRVSLREHLKNSTAKKIVSSASTSSLSSIARHPRSTARARGDAESPDKGLLESQVKELQAEAKAKDNEINNLRMELQGFRGKAPAASPTAETPGSDSSREESPEHGPVQVSDVLVMVGELREKNAKFQKELAGLREENQTLKETLLGLETSSKPMLNGLPSDSNASAPGENSPPSAGSPLRSSLSSSADIKDASSPDCSEFEKIPSHSTSACSSISSDATSVPAGNGAAGTGISVQSLTDQIYKMEESHHSTAEELQATLQELADQQQVVQELTAENERLAQDKRLLQSSLQQQRERVDLVAQKNEVLAGRLQEQAQAQAQREEELGSQAPRHAELEQRYGELVESSRFEREKLVDIQQQLTGSLRALEQEHQEAQAQARSLREERDGLQEQLELAAQVGDQAAKAAEGQRACGEGLRLDNSRLKAQVDIERQKVMEIKAMQSASDSTELQGLLKAAHEEKDRLEVELSELRQELLQAQGEAEHAKDTISKAESRCQQLQESAARREQELVSRVGALEEAGLQAENQVKELKETIFELDDQVEQQRAVHLHTNQTVLDMENHVRKLEEQKADAERQVKLLTRQSKEEKEEWRRFQADLQTAVVVANDIKVEAQQELRALRRQLQEEQHRSAKLSSDLEGLQGVRSPGDEGRVSGTDGGSGGGGGHWCGIARTTTTPTSPGDAHTEDDSDGGATVQSLIKSFDTVGPSGAGHTVLMHSTPRSPLSGIPVRSAPAAAVSPTQRLSYIKPLPKALERKINHGEFSHPDKLSGCRNDLKPTNLMRKSPSLESVIKAPGSLTGRTASFSYNRPNSKLSVERKDPLAALAREFGGSKRNALLKWCQKKTEGYPVGPGLGLRTSLLR